MNIKAVMAAVALACASGAFATPVALGVLDSDDISFGKQFWRVDHFLSSPLGTFTDYYTFSLTGNATAAGGVVSFDYHALDLTINALSLTGGTLGNAMNDSSPSSFSFSGLGAGTYTLGVAGRLNADRGDSGYARYTGTIHAVAAPVPEPEHAMMMFAGLLGLGAAGLRRKAKD